MTRENDFKGVSGQFEEGRAITSQELDARISLAQHQKIAVTAHTWSFHDLGVFLALDGGESVGHHAEHQSSLVELEPVAALQVKGGDGGRLTQAKEKHERDERN